MPINFIDPIEQPKLWKEIADINLNDTHSRARFKQMLSGLPAEQEFLFDLHMDTDDTWLTHLVKKLETLDKKAHQKYSAECWKIIYDKFHAYFLRCDENRYLILVNNINKFSQLNASTLILGCLLKASYSKIITNLGTHANALRTALNDVISSLLTLYFQLDNNQQKQEIIKKLDAISQEHTGAVQTIGNWFAYTTAVRFRSGQQALVDESALLDGWIGLKLMQHHFSSGAMTGNWIIQFKNIVSDIYPKIVHNSLAKALFLSDISACWGKIESVQNRESILQLIANDQELCHFFALCFAELPTVDLHQQPIINKNSFKENFRMFVDLRGTLPKNAGKSVKTPYLSDALFAYLDRYNVTNNSCSVLLNSTPRKEGMSWAKAAGYSTNAEYRLAQKMLHKQNMSGLLPLPNIIEDAQKLNIVSSAQAYANTGSDPTATVAVATLVPEGASSVGTPIYVASEAIFVQPVSHDANKVAPPSSKEIYDVNRQGEVEGQQSESSSSSNRFTFNTHTAPQPNKNSNQSKANSVGGLLVRSLSRDHLIEPAPSNLSTDNAQLLNSLDAPELTVPGYILPSEGAEPTALPDQMESNNNSNSTKRLAGV